MWNVIIYNFEFCYIAKFVYWAIIWMFLTNLLDVLMTDVLSPLTNGDYSRCCCYYVFIMADVITIILLLYWDYSRCYLLLCFYNGWCYCHYVLWNIVSHFILYYVCGRCYNYYINWLILLPWWQMELPHIYIYIYVLYMTIVTSLVIPSHLTTSI